MIAIVAIVAVASVSMVIDDNSDDDEVSDQVDLTGNYFAWGRNCYSSCINEGINSTQCESICY